MSMTDRQFAALAGDHVVAAEHLDAADTPTTHYYGPFPGDEAERYAAYLSVPAEAVLLSEVPAETEVPVNVASPWPRVGPARAMRPTRITPVLGYGSRHLDPDAGEWTERP